jgi:hypothetical protein
MDARDLRHNENDLEEPPRSFLPSECEGLIRQLEGETSLGVLLDKTAPMSEPLDFRAEQAVIAVILFAVSSLPSRIFGDVPRPLGNPLAIVVPHRVENTLEHGDGIGTEISERCAWLRVRAVASLQIDWRVRRFEDASAVLALASYDPAVEPAPP